MTGTAGSIKRSHLDGTPRFQFPRCPNKSGSRRFWKRQTGCAARAVTPANSATPSSNPSSSKCLVIPRMNPKGWDRFLIDECPYFVAGRDFSKNPNTERRGYPAARSETSQPKVRSIFRLISFVDLTTNEFKKLKLESGDIIFNRTNSTELVGKTACWRLDIDAVIASYLVKLRLNPNVVPKFFAALLNSAYFRKTRFEDRCKKAVGQSNISPTNSKNSPSTCRHFRFSRNSRTSSADSSACARSSAKPSARPSIFSKRSYTKLSKANSEFDWPNYFCDQPRRSSGDATRAKAFLKSLLGSPETARSFFENIDVSFHGYDDDSRELFEIQGVRDFVNKLDTEFPFWLYFRRTSPIPGFTPLRCAFFRLS